LTCASVTDLKASSFLSTLKTLSTVRSSFAAVRIAFTAVHSIGSGSPSSLAITGGMLLLLLLPQLLLRLAPLRAVRAVRLLSQEGED
jgi:hypothetical protein